MEEHMRKRINGKSGPSRISANRRVCGGVPCVRGTRIPVHVILDFLSAGDSIERLLKGYPTLTREDIQACLAYAARRTEHPVRSSL
jgi:uncharacterized protein (DUF433 family)